MFRWIRVLPNSALRGVAIESEQVIEAPLDWVHLGEHPSGLWSASISLVEQNGFLDFAERREESTHAHVESGLLGLSHSK